MTPVAMVYYSILAGLAAVVCILALATAARNADARRARRAAWPTPSQLQDAGYRFRGR